jgi:hypothetical protein
MRHKKGQAALEFLTTYGWAFLVILVMIGALAYFGVLNPKNFLPNRCTFSPEVDCIESRIVGSTGVVDFRFRNNAGSTSDFNASATYIGSSSPQVPCALNGGVAGDQVDDIQPGRVVTVSCDFADDVFVDGDKAKLEVVIFLKRSDGSYWTPIKGEIYNSVQ